MTKRRPHRHQRQSPTTGGIGATGDPRQGAGTLADRDAALPGDVGIGGDDMFGENTAAQGTGDLGKINVRGAGTDQAGFGTTEGALQPPAGSTDASSDQP